MISSFYSKAQDVLTTKVKERLAENYHNTTQDVVSGFGKDEVKMDQYRDLYMQQQHDKKINQMRQQIQQAGKKS